VLSPIEPVAPSTVTLRIAAGAAALLLRNGTALIGSPNHKGAANAIDSAAPDSENRRQHDGCDKPVKPIQ
jgi:hypothetical protein